MRLLDDERFIFFLLLDSKSDKTYDSFIPELSLSRVVCLPMIKINWGGVSQITAMLNLMQAALEYPVRIDYMHYLQGADLPLKSPDQIDEFFTANDKEFIKFDYGNQKYARYKVRCKHFFANYSRFRTSKTLNFLNHGIACLQKPFADLTSEQYHGEALFSVSRGFAEKVVSDRGHIEKRYRYSLAADEIFLQDYIMSTEFKNRLSTKNSNARLIDWKHREGNSPKTFTMEDVDRIAEAIQTEGICFGRKFDENKDREIVNFIEKTLKEEKSRLLYSD